MARKDDFRDALTHFDKQGTEVIRCGPSRSHKSGEFVYHVLSQASDAQPAKEELEKSIIFKHRAAIRGKLRGLISQ